MTIFYDVICNVLLASVCSLLNEEPGLMGGWCDLVTSPSSTPGLVLHRIIDVSVSAPRPTSPQNLIMFITWAVFSNYNSTNWQVLRQSVDGSLASYQLLWMKCLCDVRLITPDCSAVLSMLASILLFQPDA